MTITTLRPTADTYKKSISYSTGTTASSLIDDAPADDATYVYVANGVDYNHGSARMWLELPNTLAPSNTQRVRAVRYRARLRLHASDPGRSAAIGVNTRWPDDGTGTYTEKLYANSSSVFAERTGAWRTTPPQAAMGWQNKANGFIGTDDLGGFLPYTAPDEWTKAVIDKIQAYVNWYYSSGSVHTNCRLSELYFDVDVRDLGTLSTPTVSGHTTSTRPVVAWTWSENADGDRQKKYQVKIYSAAQYGAAGFNPTYSDSPVWDSGQVTGTADQVPIGVDLINGTTYRAYVRAAQDFNGEDWWTNERYVNGQRQILTSGWATSAEFTLAIAPPPAPTVEVTADETLPWLRNLIKVYSNINLLSANIASIETDATGWTADTNCSISRTTAQFLHGLASLQMSSTASGEMVARSASVPVKPGQQYTAVASFRAAVSARSCRIGIRWLDAGGGTISSAYGSNVTDGAAGWIQASYTATAPSNAASARILVSVLATGAGSEVHYVDQIGLVAGTSTIWTSGGFADVASTIVEYNWATVGARNLIHQQLWGGGDLLRSTAGFHLVSATNNRLVYDQAQRYHGQGSIRWDVRDATNGIRLRLGWDAALSPPDAAPAYALAGVPGEVYSFAIRMRASAAWNTSVRLQPIDKDGATIGSAFSSGTVVLSTSWQEIKVEAATMPTGTVWVRVEIHNVDGVANVSVWLDAPIWIHSAAVPAVLPVAGGSGKSTRWAPIRGGDLDDPDTLILSSSGDGILYFWDQEVPPGYTVTYRAWIYAPESETTPALASPYSGYVQTRLDPPGGADWVLSTISEHWVDRLLVSVVSIPESRHKEQGTFFPVRGGEQQRAVVITDYVGGLDGTLTIGLGSDEEWELLQRILGDPYQFLIAPDHGARYIALGEPSAPRLTQGPVTTSPLDGQQCGPSWVRTVEVPFVEIGRP